MPLVSRLLIKAGMIWLVLSFALGIAMYWPDSEISLMLLKPVFYHMIMFGWVTQVIMGVAFWLFPRHTKEKPRASYTLMWITFYTINTGLILRVFAEPAWDILHLPQARPLIFISVLLQLIAGTAFAFNSWYRFGVK